MFAGQPHLAYCPAISVGRFQQPVNRASRIAQLLSPKPTIDDIAIAEVLLQANRTKVMFLPEGFR